MLKKFYKNFTKALVVVIYGLSAICFAGISEEKLKQCSKDLEIVVQRAMKELCVPGAAFIVVKGDKIIHKACFGKTEESFTFDERNSRIIKKNENPTSESDVSEDTLFPLSSLSKNITAILACILVDEGIISFDDPVRKYLPDFFIANEDISSKCTIKDLLSHRCGIKHFSSNSLWSAGYDKDKIIRSLRFIKKVGGFRKKYGYQNVVFGIVGDVFEKATGMKYEDLVQKYIFNKMNLQNTSSIPLMYEKGFFPYLKYKISRFKDDYKKFGFFKTVSILIKDVFSHKSKKISRNMSLYDGKINILELNDFYHILPATSAIAMSINDVGEWLKMLVGNGKYKETRIISEKNFNEATSQIIELKDLKDDNLLFPSNRMSNIHYGMGFFSADYSDNGKNKRRIMFHMGGIYGSGTFFAYSPSDDMAIGILCNFGGTDKTLFAELMADQFFDMCFDFEKIDWIKVEMDHNKKNTSAKEKLHKDFQERNIEAQEKLSKYTGSYESEIYGNINVYTENNQLVIDNGIKAAKLTHVNANIFSFKAPDIFPNYFDRQEYVMFYKNDRGVIDSMYISFLDEGNTIFNRK